MAFPIQMYLRVSHTGFMPDGSPNPESVLIPDMDLGYEYQHRKSPVYVPVGGFINLPFVSKVIYSASQGALGRFVTAGVLNVSYFFACRNTSNFGGAGGVGIPLAGGGNNIVRNGDVLTVVIDAGTNTSGFILGELVTITGLVGAYLGIDGDFTITGFTKGADLAGINPLCCLVTFASPGANIAAGVQAPLLTLPDGMITHIFSSSGNAGGLGANVNTYLTGDLIVTGNIDPEKIIFSPVDLTGAEPNTMGVDLNSGKLVFTNETGAATEISTTIAKSGSTPLVGDVTLSAGANVALTQAGQDIQISAAAAPAAVNSLAKLAGVALTGAVTLSEGANVTLTQVGQDISIAASAGGAGDVAGPAGATSGNLAVFDGATGKIIKDGGVIVGGAGGSLVSVDSGIGVDSNTIMYLLFNTPNVFDQSFMRQGQAIPGVQASFDRVRGKFGAGCWAFPGDGVGLSYPNLSLDFTTVGDFTVDSWVLFDSLPDGSADHTEAVWFGSKDTFLTFQNCWYFALGRSAPGADVYLKFCRYRAGAENGSVTANLTALGLVPATGVWHHISVTRYGNNVRLALNGVALNAGPLVFATVATTIDRGVVVGFSGVTNGYYNLHGALSEIRVSNISRWNANFAVPTAYYGSQQLCLDNGGILYPIGLTR